jgi:hypothetical protein
MSDTTSSKRCAEPGSALVRPLPNEIERPEWGGVTTSSFMSMVPTSGTSVEVPVIAPVLMLTSVGRTRHNRVTPGSPTRTGRANDGQSVDAVEPGLRE